MMDPMQSGLCVEEIVAKVSAEDWRQTALVALTPENAKQFFQIAQFCSVPQPCCHCFSAFGDGL
jgi:hypothetical protein